MSARLYIPRALVAILTGLGLALAGGGARAALARLAVMADAPRGLRLAYFGGLGFAVVAIIGGVLLLATTVRWAWLRVDVTADGVRVRTVRRRSDIPLAELRGVVLRQDGGVPQLRLVRRAADPVVVPGWSLRARWPDGQVDDAGPALEVLGAHHGFGVKRRTLLGPVPDPPPPRGTPRRQHPS